MTNELMIKEVNFNGTNLIAAQESESGKIYVGVKWVCEGIGLSVGQMQSERLKIQDDLVLNQGKRNFVLPTNSGIQDVLCIELDFLPLWLAKISITPKMKENNPEVVQKLIDYQLKAKDVLAKAFVEDSKFEQQLSSYLDLDEDERAIAYFKERKEKRELEKQQQLLLQQNEELKPKAESFDVFMNAQNLQKMNDVAKVLGVGRNNLFKFLRNQKVLMSDNIPYQRFIDSQYFEVKEYTINLGNYMKNQAQTFVTPKGVDYLRKLLSEVNFVI